MLKDYFHCRSLLLVPFLLLAAQSIRAQNTGPGIVNATGSSAPTPNGDVYEWSVGEMSLVETMLNSTAMLTNGLLQPELPVYFITKGFEVFPANFITANGDGKNDTWDVKDIDRFPDNEVTVVDRSGLVVFQTRGYRNTWKGDLNGQPLQGNTYYYILKLRKDGQTGLVKGFITIVH